jgi:cytochrome P450
MRSTRRLRRYGQCCAFTGDAAVDEYLDALAKETVRTRPVVSDVGRVLTRPVELAGCRVELSTTTSAERQRVIRV